MMCVAKSVGLDLVPSMADFAHQLRMQYHLLAQTEEGGGEGELIEPVKHVRSGAGIRTVVEGQRDPVSARPAPPTEVAGQDTVLVERLNVLQELVEEELRAKTGAARDP